MTVKTKTKKSPKLCTFQKIPHWNDPEIGYKALLSCIKNYVSYKSDEFDRLAPVITKDEFIWDTFSNMCRRDGYPQYDKNKNKGNFYSYVQINCVRNQTDWARKRDTRNRQLAKLQGKLTGDNNVSQPNYSPNISLDELIEDSDTTSIHEKIVGDTLGYYTEELALEDISKNISEEVISEKFKLSWKDFAKLLMKGWSVVDISKELEVHPTTTRKYFSQLKEKMLEDTNIQEMLDGVLPHK